MDLFSTLSLCAYIALSQTPSPLVKQADCTYAQQQYAQEIKSLSINNIEREAITRISYAEASNQGDSGIAAVVFVILNRLISGKFQTDIEGIINAKNQFEPATTVGGWVNLKVPSEEERAKINTIINLALDGRLPDPTNGALFFQNPSVVQKREAEGIVSAGLTHFNNAQITTTIKDHTFYAGKNASIKKQLRSEENSWDAFSNPNHQHRIFNRVKEKDNQKVVF
jgi:spore germination cell wall hydrolase CwlJ-like protein